MCLRSARCFPCSYALTCYRPSCSENGRLYLHGFAVSESDRDELLSGAYISDHIVNASFSMLGRATGAWVFSSHLENILRIPNQTHHIRLPPTTCNRCLLPIFTGASQHWAFA